MRSPRSAPQHLPKAGRARMSRRTHPALEGEEETPWACTIPSH